MAELTVGCVMVVANGERHLREQLDSMLVQTVPFVEMIVIDDHSTDGSVDLIQEALSGWPGHLRILTAPSSRKGASLYTRIARNFATGIVASTADVIVLADHDDVWLPERVEIQTAAFANDPNCAFVAGDGEMIDASSAPLGYTLRAAFPVRHDWAVLDRRAQERYVLNHPVATGAASAIMPTRMPGGGHVPRGWLHDRWYSLEAVTVGGLRLDERPVIRYRKHQQQVVGDSGAEGSSSPAARVRRRMSQPVLACKKLFDLSRLAQRGESGRHSAFSFPRSVPALLLHQGKKEGNRPT